MLYVLFLALVMLPALGLAGRLGGQVPSERAALVLLFAFAFLIGGNWALAIAGLLVERALWVAAAVSGFAGAVLAWRTRSALRERVDPRAAGLLALPTLAALYVIFRGSVVPATEFDALSYHLPKAVEILRSHTIPFIPSGDFRIPNFPWNYELLLSNVLLLTHGDQQCFWIGLLATAGILACSGAILARAWPGLEGRETLLGLLFVAATPILILHAGAIKNDALFSFFLLCTLHWTARGSQGGDPGAWALALLSLALGFGTKSTALFLLPAMGLAAWRFRSRLPLPPSVRSSAALAGVVLLGFILSGSAWPILNAMWSGHPLGETSMVGGVSGFQSNAVPAYTGFGNIWKFPLLAILRPFSANPQAVWVFWTHNYWYWPSYNGIYGHFGWLCSLLLLAVPFGVRRHRAGHEGADYRRTFTWTSLVFVLLSLPQAYRVDGMFATFPRYLLCLPVLVAVWTVAPILLWARGRRILPRLMGVALTAYFTGQAFLYLLNDSVRPLPAVLRRLTTDPGRPELGVESLVDRVAGPGDSVAFDSGYGGFVYHLYGTGFTRPLVYLPRHPGPIAIPPGVKWVVIDRTWNVGWSHAGARTTADFMNPALGRGESREDLALVNQMRQNPDFVEVFANPRVNQWAFVSRKHLPQEKS